MDPTFWDSAKPIIAGQLRHLFTGFAGILVAKGALDAGQTDNFATIGVGLAFYAAGAVWSLVQKRRAAKFIEAGGIVGPNGGKTPRDPDKR